MALCLGMIKIKDVVIDPKGRILQVEGFHKGRKGSQTFILARVYRSQNRVAVPIGSVRPHKWLNN